MNENSINTIKLILNSLNFPLLDSIRETEEGYEIMMDFENNRRLPKKTVKALLEQRGLTVEDIDVFTDSCGHYMYALVKTGEETDG